MRRRPYHSPLLTLCSVAVVLWVYHWWSDRPIFLDEANVIRNLFDRTFPELFHPLDHEQAAPPLYLVLTKLFGELFGYSERVMRLPSLLGAIAGLGGLVWAGRRLKLGWWSLALPCFILLNDFCLRYFGSVKPYSIDLAVSAGLFAYALHQPVAGRTWYAVGALAPWLSLPSIFVLAGIGLTRVFQTHKSQDYTLHWVGAGVLWLTSIGLLYFLTLDDAVADAGLALYHQAYFFPIWDGWLIDFPATGALLWSLLRVPFGHTVLAAASGIMLCIYAMLKVRNATVTLLFLPILLCVSATSFGFYTLMPRLMLFAAPAWWLLATIGSKYLYDRLSAAPARWVAVALLIAAITGVNLQALSKPPRFSDTRRLVLDYNKAYTPVPDDLAFPAFDYYYRIHPAGPGILPHFEPLSHAHGPGKFVYLYDVTTSDHVRQKIAQTRIWADDRRCNVRTKKLYRASALYLDCPE